MKFVLIALAMLPLSSFASYYTAVKIADCQGIELVEVRTGSFDTDRTVTETTHFEVMKGDVSVKAKHVIHEDIEEFRFTFDGVESFISSSYEFTRIGGWSITYRLDGKLCKKL